MQEKRDFNLVAANWDEEPRRVALADAVASAILATAVPTPAMRVLDFGCGTGLLSLPWAHRVGHLTGIDAASEMLAVFRQKAAAMALPAIATRHLPELDEEGLGGPFDLIVSSMTLHHIADVPALLGAMRRSLAPGGKICLADLDPDAGQFHSDPTGVFHHGFERATLQEQARQAGFSRPETQTATVLTRPGADGVVRDFSIFLLLASA